MRGKVLRQGITFLLLGFFVCTYVATVEVPTGGYFENFSATGLKTIQEIIYYPLPKTNNYIYDFCYALSKYPSEVNNISLLVTSFKSVNQVDITYTEESTEIDYHGTKTYNQREIVVLQNAEGYQNNWTSTYIQGGIFQGKIYSLGPIFSAELVITGKAFTESEANSLAEAKCASKIASNSMGGKMYLFEENGDGDGDGIQDVLQQNEEEAEEEEAEEEAKSEAEEEETQTEEEEEEEKTVKSRANSVAISLFNSVYITSKEALTDPISLPALPTARYDETPFTSNFIIVEDDSSMIMSSKSSFSSEIVTSRIAGGGSTDSSDDEDDEEDNEPFGMILQFPPNGDTNTYVLIGLLGIAFCFLVTITSFCCKPTCRTSLPPPSSPPVSLPVVSTAAPPSPQSINASSYFHASNTNVVAEGVIYDDNNSLPQNCDLTRNKLSRFTLLSHIINNYYKHSFGIADPQLPNPSRHNIDITPQNNNVNSINNFHNNNSNSNNSNNPEINSSINNISSINGRYYFSRQNSNNHHSNDLDENVCPQIIIEKKSDLSNNNNNNNNNNNHASYSHINELQNNNNNTSQAAIRESPLATNYLMAPFRFLFSHRNFFSIMIHTHSNHNHNNNLSSSNRSVTTPHV